MCVSERERVHKESIQFSAQEHFLCGALYLKHDISLRYGKAGEEEEKVEAREKSCSWSNAQQS